VAKWIPIQEIRKSIANLKTHFPEMTMSKHDGIVLEMSIKSSLLQKDDVILRVEVEYTTSFLGQIPKRQGPVDCSQKLGEPAHEKIVKYGPENCFNEHRLIHFGNAHVQER
jgi:hypothetical protein